MRPERTPLDVTQEPLKVQMETFLDEHRAALHACLELFGVERCFFGTNWPVDRQYSSYGDVLDAFEVLVADLTDEEQAALFATNTERIFTI